MWASTVDRLYGVKQTNASSCVQMDLTLSSNLSGTLKAFPPMRLNAVCLIYTQIDGTMPVSSTEYKHGRLHMKFTLIIPRLRSGCLLLISPRCASE